MNGLLICFYFFIKNSINFFSIHDMESIERFLIYGEDNDNNDDDEKCIEYFKGDWYGWSILLVNAGAGDDKI